jgi:hypothetical protein
MSNIYAAEVDWPINNAVAYIAKKTMFIFKDVTVIGVNSNIAFSKATLNDGVILTMSIPISDFKTNDSDRDEEVQKILQIQKSKFLIFRSNKISKNDYQSMLNGKSTLIDGLLAIGENNHPVTFRSLTKDQYILFDFESSFSNFEIDPPTVAFGLIAKAKDYLLLQARININDF